MSSKRQRRVFAHGLPQEISVQSPTTLPLSANESERKHIFSINAARTRLEAYQQRWMKIGEILPPQINRRHISVISIGGVIGMGLYISTATAMRHAGPVGTLLGFTITSSVVWAVVVSIGEIVSFLPNVGGMVGLAGVYVDPALGFALGWNGWYNWTIVLPTELSAAAILISAFFRDTSVDVRTASLISISIMLIIAVGINCFGARYYGEAEFFFSCIKLLTIVVLIILGMALDVGAGAKGHIGFRNWRNPGPFCEYRGSGNLGRFLGVWSSISQAVFAFYGTEVPGLAAGEVQNPTRNIPRAVRRVWIRIMLFYILAVFVAGLLVPSNDPRLLGSDTTNSGEDKATLSPFIIALQDSGWKYIDKIINAALVLSAFSAATSDVYISSRFLFFLAQRNHAPRFCAGTLKTKKTVVPWVGILIAFCFGSLAFMSVSNAEEAFYWLSSMTSVTALLAWIGMLITYLRWYQGTRYAERRDPDPNTGFKRRNQKHLYANRNSCQPWTAIYAFSMCILILVFNGWFVFTRPGPWRIARMPSDPPQALTPDTDIGQWVPTFISSYLPLPLYVLSTLGYKLIYRTRMVRIHEMNFDRGTVPDIEEYKPTTLLGKILAFLF